MLRLLIWVALAYLVYLALTKKVRRAGRRQEQMRPPSGGYPQVDDEMLKDPECGIYFPSRDGVTAVVNGQTLTFCSTACRDRYLARHTPNRSR